MLYNNHSSPQRWEQLQDHTRQLIFFLSHHIYNRNQLSTKSLDSSTLSKGHEPQVSLLLSSWTFCFLLIYLMHCRQIPEATTVIAAKHPEDLQPRNPTFQEAYRPLDLQTAVKEQQSNIHSKLVLMDSFQRNCWKFVLQCSSEK